MSIHTLQQQIDELREKVNHLYQQQNKDIMNQSEAAAYLGVSSPTLKKYVENGYIRCNVRGGRRFFKVSDLDNLKNMNF